MNITVAIFFYIHENLAFLKDFCNFFGYSVTGKNFACYIFQFAGSLSVSSEKGEPLSFPLSCVVKPVIRVAPETAVRHGGG